MVVVSLQFLWGYENPFPNGLYKWLIHRGYYSKYLLSGVALQVSHPFPNLKSHYWRLIVASCALLPSLAHYLGFLAALLGKHPKHQAKQGIIHLDHLEGEKYQLGELVDHWSLTAQESWDAPPSTSPKKKTWNQKQLVVCI